MTKNKTQGLQPWDVEVLADYRGRYIEGGSDKAPYAGDGAGAARLAVAGYLRRHPATPENASPLDTTFEITDKGDAMLEQFTAMLNIGAKA